MTGDRIRSRDGNVIAADFRPRRTDFLTIELTAETLYCDDHVLLTRTTASLGGKPLTTIHLLGDLATGSVTTL